jgi:hypothetical protein
MDESNVVLSPDARIASCEERQITLGLAGPLNERLDRLVELADSEGARTNRKELIAALVLAAPASGTELADAVITFRKARARDAAVDEDLGRILLFKRHQPGPRRKRAANRR